MLVYNYCVLKTLSAILEAQNYVIKTAVSKCSNEEQWIFLIRSETADGTFGTHGEVMHIGHWQGGTLADHWKGNWSETMVAVSGCSPQIQDCSISYFRPLWWTNIPSVCAVLWGCRLHDNSICLLLTERHIVSMTTRMHYSLAFWWKGPSATTVQLTLGWTFCLCVFNVSSKTEGQRRGQLFHTTVATIVCMLSYTCVWSRSSPRCKLQRLQM